MLYGKHRSNTAKKNWLNAVAATTHGHLGQHTEIGADGCPVIDGHIKGLLQVSNLQ